MTCEDLTPKSGLFKRLIHGMITYAKQHIFVTVTSVTMMITGIAYARINFPELPLYKIVLGGSFFGLFCAACALGYRLFEID